MLLAFANLQDLSTKYKTIKMLCIDLVMLNTCSVLQCIRVVRKTENPFGFGFLNNRTVQNLTCFQTAFREKLCAIHS